MVCDTIIKEREKLLNRELTEEEKEEIRKEYHEKEILVEA